MQKATSPISRKAQLETYHSEDLSEEASTARGLNAQSSENSGSYDETSTRLSSSKREDAQDISIKAKFPKKATDILKAWLIEHIDHPYPSDEVKDELGRAAGLNRRQIQNWFTNTRKRYVQPLKKKLEESKPSSEQLEENEPMKKTLKIFTSSSKSSQLTNALEKKMSAMKVKQETSEELKKGAPENLKIEFQEAPAQTAQPTQTTITALPSVSSQTPTFLGQLNTPLLNPFNLMFMQKQPVPFSFMPLNTLFAPTMNYRQEVATPVPVWQNAGMPIYMPNIITLPMMSSQPTNQNTIKQGVLKIHPVIQLERINTSESTSNLSSSPISLENTGSLKGRLLKPNHEEIRDFAFKKVRKD